MKKSIYLLFSIFSIVFTVLNCKKKDIPLADSSSENIDSIAAKYYEQYLKLNPFVATLQGDPRYNDLLPININAEAIAGEISFYNSVQQQLKKVNYAALSDEKKVIYDVLDFTLKTSVEAYAYHPEYYPFTQFSGLPLDFPVYGSGEGAQPFKTARDYDNWFRRMEKFPEWMDAAIFNFKEGMSKNYVLPQKLVEKMIPQMRGEEIISEDMEKNIFYGPIRKFPKNLSVAEKEKYAAKYQEIITKSIIPSYQKMATFLQSEYLPKSRTSAGINALPNGDEMYVFLAKYYTTTNLSPAEVNTMGVQQVTMLRSEMELVKQQVGFKGSLEQFLAHVKTDPKAMPYKSNAEVLGAFNGILTKIQPGLKKMFNVTPKTGFEIRQTEKFREASASAEYIQGTPDGKRPGIFYIPLPDPKKFNVTSGMESLFLHEAIPGHHYQVSLQQENTRLPKFMRFGWFGAYGEGWAHYCETLGAEFGLYTDPYQKMGYLSDQMLRAVRLVIDTSIHSGKMSREEAIAYFLRNVAYDEASATAEVERYMAIPGQALGYKIGALKIKELRDRYTKDLGTNFNIAKFHDEVLSQGCLPLSVLERKMENWAKKQKL